MEKPGFDLARLPVEVLKTIFVFSKTWRAIELWKTGDRTLMSKIANNGIHSIRLQLYSGLISQVSLPKCVESIALTALRFDTCLGHLSPGHFNEQLKSLSTPNLKTLKLISSSGLLEALFSEDHIFDWTPRFPALQKLDIRAPATRSPGPFGSFVFPYLPRSLLYFNLTSAFPYDISTFEGIPPNLQALHLPMTITPETLRLGLPTSLTKFGFGFAYEALVTLALEPNLLPNLIDFPSVPSEKLVEFFGTLKEKGVPIPLGMTSLYTPQLPVDVLMENMPSKLTTLWLESDTTTFGRTFLMALPHTLEGLSLKTADWQSIESHHWPSNMTSFSLSSSPDFGPLHFHRLPRGLKYLFQSLAQYGSLNTEELDHAQLLGLGLAQLATNDQEQWQKIKRDLVRDYHESSAAVERYISAVELGGLYGLPLGITTLKLGLSAHQCTVDLLLSPCTTVVRVESIIVASKASFWNHLSPSVSSIAIRSMQRSPRSMDTTDWEICKIEDATTTELYHSKTLKELTLFGGSTVAHISPLFKYLPRGLQSFDITSGSPLTAAHISELPPNLKRLMLSASIVGPVDDCLKALPQSLQDLSLLKDAFQGEHLRHLPPLLTYLNVVVEEVLLQHIRDIPSSNLLKLRLILRTAKPGFLTLDEMRALGPSLNSFAKFRTQQVELVL